MFLETSEAGDKGLKRSGAAGIPPLLFYRLFQWTFTGTGLQKGIIDGGLLFRAGIQREAFDFNRNGETLGEIWLREECDRGTTPYYFLCSVLKYREEKHALTWSAFFLYRYCLVRPHFKVKQTPQTYIQIVALDYHKQP